MLQLRARARRSQPTVWRRTSAATMAAGVLVLAGCEAERRNLGPAPPLSPPTGLADARAQLYATNRYEMSEGGRTFRKSTLLTG